jgi:hypothetical protein
MALCVAWMSTHFRLFRDLSASIAPKRNLLAVDVTVSLAYSEKKSRILKYARVPETIEWE